MLLTTLQVFSAASMATLSNTNAMYITVCAMLHSCCCRHGQFEYRTPRRGDITWNYHSQSYIWSSTWRKTNKSNTVYYMHMPRRPHRAAGYYHVHANNNIIRVSAADILSWYLQRRDTKHGRNATDPLFPAMPTTLRREKFCKWMSKTFATVMGSSSTLHRRIRPHVWRAGWVTDNRRDMVPDLAIMKDGRWKDLPAMLKYDRESLRSLYTSSRICLHSSR